jgi:DNA-binding CsgD family transcriptional regulator
MYLSIRDARSHDLQPAFPLLQRRLGIPEALRARYLAFLESALATGACVGLVVEDRDQPAGQRFGGLALTFCVSEDLVQRIRRDSPPFLWRWLLERWEAGEPVWLTRAAARQAQLERGANVLVLTWGVDDLRYEEAAAAKLKEAMAMAFQTELTRHRVHRFFEEVFGAMERERFLFFGCEEWRNYREGSWSASLDGVNAEAWPYVMGADLHAVRQDLGKIGTPIGRQAHLGPPRYGFKDTEQAVMRLAGRGLTDEEIAEQLGLSVPGVKKRWHGIYERVAARDPGLLGSAEEEEGRGGKQRRRKVVQLVLEHPEEFWPSPEGS